MQCPRMLVGVRQNWQEGRVYSETAKDESHSEGHHDSIVHDRQYTRGANSVSYVWYERLGL